MNEDVTERHENDIEILWTILCKSLFEIITYIDCKMISFCVASSYLMFLLLFFVSLDSRLFLLFFLQTHYFIILLLFL